MRREFWGVQLLTLINSLAYYSLYWMAGPYLHDELGFDWPTVGWFGGLFVALIASFSFICGMVTDRIGFRNGMLLGATSALIGRAGLGALPFLSLGPPELRSYVIWALVLTALGEAFLQPIIAAGTARFSSKEMRTTAFNTQVVVLQIGGGFLVAILVWITRSVGESLSPIYFVASALSVPTALVAYLFMKDESPAASCEGVPAQQGPSRMVSSWTLLREIVREKSFWMLVILLVILTGSRMAFYLQPLYVPYYMATLGRKVELGQLLLINPTIIMVGLILFNSTFDKIRPYARLTLWMGVIVGSVLVLAIPPQVLQLYGVGIDQAYYTMIIVQLVVFSVGEMLFSPSIKQYIMRLAPIDKLTSYAGVLNLFVIPAKFLPPVVAGYLLAMYCPDGTRDRVLAGGIPYTESPQMMFVIMGMILMTGPVFLLLAQRWYKR